MEKMAAVAVLVMASSLGCSAVSWLVHRGRSQQERGSFRPPLSCETFGDRRWMGAPGLLGSRGLGPQHVSW